MQHSIKGLRIPGAMLLVLALLYGTTYSFTCSGSLAAETNPNGNYVLGMPIGGIGGGNFNLLPDGNYNRTYCRVTPVNGTEPLLIGFAKQGNSIWSSDLKHAGSMTTICTGYWPTIHMQYQQANMPVGISLECFSPICAGDNKNSSLPLAVFIFTLTNTTTTTDTAAIALSNAAAGTIIRSNFIVRGIKSGALCVMVSNDGAADVTCGTNKTDFTADGLLDGTAGGILASRIVVAPLSSRKITFTVAWTNVTNGYYRKYYADAESLATYGQTNAAILKTKVDNWHNKILDSNLPDWLKDMVINNCHVYNSMTDWITPNTYGMAESMSNGHYGTLDQLYHASIALPIFAPDAAWSEVGRIAEVQQANGLFLHFYNKENNDIRSDGGTKFILQLYRNYLWTGDLARLQALYPTVQRAITGVQNLDTRDSDGLSDDSLINTYDNPFWEGWNIPEKVYDCELYLAALKAAARIAAICNDTASATNYNNLFTAVSASFERINATGGFWNTTSVGPEGKTGYYTGSTNVGGSGKGLGCWNSQLAGQWYADMLSLGPLHPVNRIQSALQFINAACLDQRANPCYALMCALPNVNLADNSTYFNSSEGGYRYVTYIGYPAGDLCVAFGHGYPDIAMRALNIYWNVIYNKYKRVWNQPCKVTAEGFGTGWGIGRYMTTPGAFASLFGITGFSIDVAARTMRLKPSLPTGMDSLRQGPLMNPLSLGTLDYRKDPVTGGQRLFVRFDTPMRFDQIFVKKIGAQRVTVTRQGVTVPATIGINPEDTSEYRIVLGSTLTIDDAGVRIITGDYPDGVHPALLKKANAITFTVDMNRGTMSYRLPGRMEVSLSLVNALGRSVRKTFFHSEEKEGLHVVRYDWKNEAAGVYFVRFTAGAFSSTQRLIVVR